MHLTRPWLPRFAALVLTLTAVPSQVRAQGVELVPGDTVLATPRQRYPAGALHRFVLGDGHRNLWVLPIPAVVLDLDDFAGGLTVAGRGGGLQTASLRLLGADGRAYRFRSIDKDASRTLPTELRETVAARVLQDQISSLFPLSAMVVTPLLAAAGVLHAKPELAVMPDDARLGEHRSEFAGLLGWIEERPDEGEDGRPGFAGSRRVVGSDRLFELLEEGPQHRVAARAFLRARLLDVLVGDWDRHPGQWRWARFERGGVYIYQPIPRDRDWALARIDGIFTWVTWVPWPQYMGFGPDLGNEYRHTWNGQALDRRILPELTRAEWRVVVGDLIRRLSDAVISDAVAQLPESYREAVGEQLERSLIRRRDQLSDFADAYYRLVVGSVDVRSTDQSEVILAHRISPDSLRVEVFVRPGDEPATYPFVRRTFVSTETKEVRIYAQGGDDQVVVSGDGTAPLLRVIGGGGDDDFEDRTSGRAVFFYDSRGENRFRPAPRTGVDTRPWREPVDPNDNTQRLGARDWGSRSVPAMEVAYSPDWGLIGMVGGSRTRYGFRRWPFQSRLTALAGVASETGRIHGRVTFDAPLSRDLRARFEAALKGAEVRRFYGVGNETEELLDDDFYEAQRREYALTGSLFRRLAGPVEASVGVAVQRFRDMGNEGTLIDSLAPYGFPDFDQLGLSGSLAWRPAAREHLTETPPSFAVEAVVYPAMMDVRSVYGAVSTRAALSRTFGTDRMIPPTVAIRLGAAKILGDAPYHGSAFIGGRTDLRGHRNHRFAGEASVYLNTELRLGLGRFFLMLPGDLGAIFLVDTGRVWADGEASTRWHTALGGGVFASFLRSYTASLAIARGEITSAYLSVGFAF